VGIATQDAELRKRFAGKPEHVVNFFHFLAQDLREVMAELGFRTVNEMVGKVEMLKMKKELDHWKLKHLDLSPILYKEPADDRVRQYKSVPQDHGIADVLDWKLVAYAKHALEEKAAINSIFPIKNTDRSVGTILSHEISTRYKKEGLPDAAISFRFVGSAGQSFGAFGAKGIQFTLEGEANDYFGKGLSGGRLIVSPSTLINKEIFKPEENIIIGNVALYGATSGEVFIKGMAGERFAVRNSGATAVVEGVGDHGCEYMTGGEVVVLGETGKNFAAGMSGGVAYMYDPNGKFPKRCNKEMVDLEKLEQEDKDRVRQLVRKHLQFTGSRVASAILQNWDTNVEHFVKVMPRDYKAVLAKRKAAALAEAV
jgi:glutamate synthase (NADPH/NADH) large chain